MDTPTVCHSIIGSMTARFDKDTPDEIVRLASDELLFFIRSKMASDSYVSSSIMKVIYVGPRESIVSESQSQSQNEGKNNASTIVAIVMSIIVILLVLLFVLVVVKKRRRKSNKGSLSNRFSRIGYTANESLPISDTEQTWRRALIIDDTWKKALNTYERNSKVVIHPDQVIDKEDSHCADDAAVELMMDNKDEQEQQHDESLMHAKQTLEEGRSRRRRRKQKYVAQDVNDRLEPSNDYDQFTIDGVHPIEVTQNEPSDQSAVQDVQIVEDFNEVVTVTSVDSEEQYPSSSYGVGIEHTFYGDDDDDENDDDDFAQQQGPAIRDDEDEPEQSHYESNNHGDEVKYDGEVGDGSASRSDSFNNSWCYDEEENKT